MAESACFDENEESVIEIFDTLFFLGNKHWGVDFETFNLASMLGSNRWSVHVLTECTEPFFGSVISTYGTGKHPEQLILTLHKLCVMCLL